MQPRQAAFRLLRRIALQDFKPTVAATPFLRQPPLSRNLHTTRCLRDSSSETPSTAPFNVPRATPSETPAEQPAYELTFTCKPCSARSTHKVSKQGYHQGSVLIQCPGCKNRHVISDNMGIFGSNPTTLEDIIKEKGQLMKKGTLSEDGDFEVWADGSATRREKQRTEKKEEKEEQA